MRKTIVIALMCVVVAAVVALVVWTFVEQRRQDIEVNRMGEVQAPTDSAAAYADTTAAVGGP